LVTATASAYMGGQGVNTNYGTNNAAANPYGSFGGMMGGGRMGGMMGFGTCYGYDGNYSQSYGQCNATAVCPYQNNLENGSTRAGCHGYCMTP